ncbi:MAG TPA: thymidylate kinase [Acidobacteriota bacterium]|nr:thymidylate kinase [Acidobacteriota bacterium]HQM63741.1 thymidylate kinase [Acidobacteriota bacterium]
MLEKRCYRASPPGVDPDRLGGLLIVVEGPDSSGRSTQIRMLSEWLEQKGFAVAQVGLKRSALVSAELERAMQGNVLSPRTMSLFYATDFYDQLENSIVPALRAGSIVLADRYIFTLIARDVVRGANPAWVETLYSRALVPDAVYYLTLSPRSLVDRTLEAHGYLDYWESGMDIGHSRDWFESFVWYQRRIREEFGRLQNRFRFETINANRSVRTTQNDLRKRIDAVLQQALAKL